MATLSLYTGENTIVPTDYGLGFFGNDGFGAPVVIGTYQGRTFVTNASGTVENFECNNNKYLAPSSVIYGQAGSGILLTELPNELATINIRFTHGTTIYTQLCKIYIYDGTSQGIFPNICNPPTGMSFYAAEIVHPSNIQTDIGHGNSIWSEVTTSGANSLNITNSPGELGVRNGGPSYILDDRHDWYIALSCSPTELGNKQFGVFVTLEYL
jgi:hypothetical protein